VRRVQYLDEEPAGLTFHAEDTVASETIQIQDKSVEGRRSPNLHCCIAPQRTQVRQSPRTYGLDPPSAALASDASFDRWLTERLVGQAVARLSEIGLVGVAPWRATWISGLSWEDRAELVIAGGDYGPKSEMAAIPDPPSRLPACLLTFVMGDRLRCCPSASQPTLSFSRLQWPLAPTTACGEHS
jgi:hypothetical protein